jgi:MYXO-CTERM domain-containing protein
MADRAALALASIALLPMPAAAQDCATGSASSITQYGVTFTFDASHRCGRFANGDYWVAPATGSSQVVVTDISPPFTAGRNGWEVNPSSPEANGFDDRIAGYDAALVPALPYAASPDESLVKTVSVPDGECRIVISGNNYLTCLLDAVVLTVLAAPPEGDGADLFRPPYFGAAKPLYRVADLDTSLLPSLAAPAGAPSLDWVVGRYERVQLDHMSNWTGRAMHPFHNMPDYGADIGRDSGDAALRLLLDDPPAARQPALVAYVQAGIDLFHMQLGGTLWNGGGGHGSGRKLPIALAGVLLHDDAMMAAVRDAVGTYAEDLQVYFGAGAGRALWGEECSEEQYWDVMETGTGNRSCRDPYGWIDGGEEPGGPYQACCTTAVWKGTALALHLVPELRCVWDNEIFVEYLDRWVDHGLWMQPDPYSPSGRGAMDVDPSDGTGRFPAAHGTMRDEGGYGSSFAGAMWTMHRAGAAPSACAIDGGVPPAADAGVRADAGGLDGGTEPPPATGCGCRAAGPSAPPLGSALAVLALALYRRARRKSMASARSHGGGAARDAAREHPPISAPSSRGLVPPSSRRTTPPSGGSGSGSSRTQR